MNVTDKSKEFLKLIKDHQGKKKAERFSGTLKDYFKLLEEDSDIPKLAHKRLFDSIASKGITRLSKSDSRCNKLFNSEELRTYGAVSSKDYEIPTFSVS
jgi:serine protein kinase